VATCSWSGGCRYEALGGELCYYHGKLWGGLITTTRSQTPGRVRPVAMPPAERAEASRRRDNYFRNLPPAGFFAALDTFANGPLSHREATDTAPDPHADVFGHEVRRDRELDRRHGTG
jgi:hypothetical protein